MSGVQDPAPLSADCHAIACRATDRTRQRATLFSGFLSHYLLRDRYGRPGKGNERASGGAIGSSPMANGNVEGLVGTPRRNFMVPIPRFATRQEFNACLEDRCRRRQTVLGENSPPECFLVPKLLRGQSETIGERLARDLAAMADLPAAPFDACDQTTGRVSSQALTGSAGALQDQRLFGARSLRSSRHMDPGLCRCGRDRQRR